MNASEAKTDENNLQAENASLAYCIKPDRITSKQLQTLIKDIVGPGYGKRKHAEPYTEASCLQPFTFSPQFLQDCCKMMNVAPTSADQKQLLDCIMSELERLRGHDEYSENTLIALGRSNVHKALFLLQQGLKAGCQHATVTLSPKTSPKLGRSPAPRRQRQANMAQDRELSPTARPHRAGKDVPNKRKDKYAIDPSMLIDAFSAAAQCSQLETQAPMGTRLLCQRTAALAQFSMAQVQAAVSGKSIDLDNIAQLCLQRLAELAPEVLAVEDEDERKWLGLHLQRSSALQYQVFSSLVRPANSALLARSIEQVQFQLNGRECQSVAVASNTSTNAVTALHVDQQHCIVGHDSGVVRIYNVLAPAELMVEWQAHSDAVLALKSSSDDSAIVLTGSADHLVKLWHATSNFSVPELAATFTAHTGWVRSISIRPAQRNFSQFVSASGDKTLRLWSRGDHDSLSVLKCHDSWIMKVQWLDSDTIITCSTDCTACVVRLSAAKMEVIFRVTELTCWLNDLATFGGQYVAFAGGDGCIRVYHWDGTELQLEHMYNDFAQQDIPTRAVSVAATQSRMLAVDELGIVSSRSLIKGQSHDPVYTSIVPGSGWPKVVVIPGCVMASGANLYKVS
eukprot:TRINITY_DN23904_c0_g1_i1.p1 TRINITY_DN23904_c0_g1~~TRINITY_DN23904_c0_g1_i1.p1  ORF type:complete len:624 (+),score=97.20 TRINITY_DN23904_c0_g1_i1:367-2238(+)